MRCPTSRTSPQVPRFGIARTAVALALLAIAALSTLPVAQAQQWKELSEVTESREGKTAAPNMLRSGTVTNQEQYEGYFRMRVAELTLEKLRFKLQKLVDDQVRLAKAGQGGAHEEMNRILLKECTSVVQDAEFSPAARINALLMISNLNERETPNGATASTAPPVPYAKALPFLTEMADPARCKDGADDALLMIAIEGLERHARTPTGIAGQDNLRKTQQDLLALLTSQRPDHRAEDVHTFYRMKAAETLGAIGLAGTESGGSQVATALLAMIADPKLTFVARTRAAESLSQLDLKGLRDLDVAKLAGQIGSLAVEVMNKETKRRVLKSDLLPLQALLNGSPDLATRSKLIDLADADGKAKVTELWTRLESIMKLIDNKKVDEIDFPVELTKLNKDLKGWLQQNLAVNAGGDADGLASTEEGQK